MPTDNTFPSAIFCLTTSRGLADRIIHDLKDAAFLSTDVGVLFFDRNAENNGGRDIRTLTSAAAQSAGPIRGGLAWVAGIGRLVVPGIGAFIAAGPIIAALHQARTRAPGVAIARGLIGLGVASLDATRIEQRIKTDGHILISVHTTNSEKLLRARDIFAGANAQEILTTADTSLPPTESPATVVAISTLP